MSSSTRTLRSRAVKVELPVESEARVDDEALKEKSPRKRKKAQEPSKIKQEADIKLEDSQPTDTKQSKLELPKSVRKSSVSPKKEKSSSPSSVKDKVKNEKDETVNDIENGGWEPNNWKTVWENILKMRKLHVAPVDSLGCEECPEKDTAPEVSVLQSLFKVI